jgi:hypothetical protein
MILIRTTDKIRIKDNEVFAGVTINYLVRTSDSESSGGCL